MHRKIYHVVRHDDAWKVRQERAERSSGSFRLKRYAVAYGRALAILAGASAQLIVHDRNGRIQAEWTYGNDPRRTRG